MASIPKGIIILIVLLSVHLALCLIGGASFLFVGTIMQSIKPGHELWQQMLQEIQQNPELMSQLESTGLSLEEALEQFMPAMSVAMMLIGVFFIAVAIMELITAVFLYKGKSWAKSLGIIVAIVGMIFPGLISLNPLFIAIGLVFALPTLYFLLLDIEVKKFLEGKKQAS